MFLVTISARPSPDSEDFTEIGGAYVNCWVQVSSEEEAIARAVAEIREGNWIPEEVDEVQAVDRETYAEADSPGREYFEQALLDGVVVVYHTWPNEPQDEDGVH